VNIRLRLTGPELQVLIDACDVYDDGMGRRAMPEDEKAALTTVQRKLWRHLGSQPGTAIRPLVESQEDGSW